MSEAVRKPQTDQSRAIVRRIIQVLIGMAIIVGSLFISAGTLKWPAVWIYLALYVLGIVINVIFIDPALIAERSQVGDNTKDWDRRLSAWALLTLQPLTFIVAGLDHRFGWTQAYSLTIMVAGLIVMVLGQALVSWALISNRFFALTVRVQAEREHEVITSGPYAIIRHPGYAGIIYNILGAVIMFNTLWALIPFAVGTGLLVARTALEDRTLQQELTGYREYAERTRFRLIPGIW